MLTKAIGDRVQLVGDDLFVTNVERLATALRRRLATPSSSRSPDRHPDRDPGAIQMANRARLHRHRVSPLRRDRGCHHRRHRRGPERRPDQDRRPQPHRPRGQVQPAAPHRGGAGRRGRVSRHERFLQPEVSFQVLQHSRRRAACAFPVAQLSGPHRRWGGALRRTSVFAAGENLGAGEFTSPEHFK